MVNREISHFFSAKNQYLIIACTIVFVPFSMSVLLNLKDLMISVTDFLFNSPQSFNAKLTRNKN